MTIRLALRHALLGLAALPLALQAGEASAQKGGKSWTKANQKEEVAAPAPATKKGVALGAFTGKRPRRVRTWVRQALENEVALTDAARFKVEKTEAGYARMASELGVEVVVIGKVERKRVKITVLGPDGRALQEIAVKGTPGPRLKKALQAQVAEAISGGLKVLEERAAAQELAEREERREREAAREREAGEEPIDQAAEGATDAAPNEASEVGRVPTAGQSGSPLIVIAGVRFSNRALTFKDTLTELRPGVPLGDPAYAMRNYQLKLGPAVFVRGQLFPGALLGSEGTSANVALIGGFEHGFSLDTQYRSGSSEVSSELKNRGQEWYVGSRVRFSGEGQEFGTALSYGKQRFTIEGDETFPIVPDVDYGYLRLGGDASLEFGRLFAGVEFGVRLLFSTGDLERRDLWFPNATGKGIDLGLRLGYPIFGSLALILGGDFVRYGFDFNPINRQTATRVAGGAIDQYIAAFLALRFAISGREEDVLQAAGSGTH